MWLPACGSCFRRGAAPSMTCAHTAALCCGCSDIFMMGPKPVSQSDMATVDKVIKDLRISPEVAQDIFAKVRATERAHSG